MAVALLNGDGDILGRTVLATEAEQGFGRAVDRLGTAIELLMRDAGAGDLLGIGIGCAGPVDPVQGLINNPFTLTGWDRCDIVTPLRERFRIPVYLENDADAAAVGECALGAGRGFDPVVMLTFGTGIGGAAIVRGGIYRGVNGEHPELGHVPVGLGGTQCYCGIAGCLESVVSGTAIGLAGQSIGCPDARSVFAAAESGRADARAILDRALQAACSAAWTICHTFLPQRLVLGGGIMDEHFAWVADGMREYLATATQFTHRSVGIARATLGSDAGVAGAAMLVFLTSGRLERAGHAWPCG
jgi:glucokinase